MESFAELLTLYIRQAGITDSELARTIGVSRQTIFRWKEGLTGRPNKREDIITIAAKLRLSPEERDALLLAGGFRPDSVPASTADTPGLAEETAAVEEEPELKQDVPERGMTRGLFSKYRRLIYYAGATVVVIVTAIVLVVVNKSNDVPDGTGTSANLTGGSTASPAFIMPASSGESLILVTQFGNTGNCRNLTKQIAMTINREAAGYRIDNLRVESTPDTPTGRQQASGLIREKNACLIIYGDCGSSLVTIYLLPSTANPVPVIEIDAGDPVSLNAVSLVALAEACLERQDTGPAYAFLSRAVNDLNDSGVSNDTLSAIITGLLAEAGSLRVE